MNQTFMGLYITELGGETGLIGWAVFASAIFEVPVFLLLDRYLKKEVRSMMLCLIFVGMLFAVRWFVMAAADSALQVMAVSRDGSLLYVCGWQRYVCHRSGGIRYLDSDASPLEVCIRSGKYFMNR